MLYETFNSLKEAHGEDYFIVRINDEVVQNLNPNLVLREYQKEAMGRFDFYYTEYQKRKFPSQLLYHMATGSGKTLIMAAAILYLYKQGYRKFIFFVNSVNIIEKTKDNFLNQESEKYLFAPKITIDDKKVLIKEVQNFEAASPSDINILFTTIQGIHTRLNNPKENALTYADFDDNKIVLISDEAHHLQVLTKSKLTPPEEKNKDNWEFTVERILNCNPQNILLEFTATIDLSHKMVRQKYKDKIIYQYDLKQFRLDKYSKELEVLQADLEPIDRALQAMIFSQYRRKIAEKHGIRLKPVLLLKSKSIKDSKVNYDNFLERMAALEPKDIENIATRAKGTALAKAFDHFQREKINYESLIDELREEFAEDKCMLLDSENVDEEKQVLLNSLEEKQNEVRAIFAVNMLNEGWDVLNLFDIVRLYNTRDGNWVQGKYKPGNTTIGEAQLIGRGARYFPFRVTDYNDKYKRKYDDDVENELRIIETLHYHNAKNSKYIDEIKSVLTELGIYPEKHVDVPLFIKDPFKSTDIWKKGFILLNSRVQNLRDDIFSLADAEIEQSYSYEIRTGEIKEELMLSENNIRLRTDENTEIGKTKYKLADFGYNVIRTALDRNEFFRFNRLKKYFPHIRSINEFISTSQYLGEIEVEVTGPKHEIENINNETKLDIVLMVAKSISEKARISTADYVGSKEFKPARVQDVFKDKVIKIDVDGAEGKRMKDIDLANKDWYAQNDFYGTDEERNFIVFIDETIEKLKQKYSSVFLLRNEKHFQIFDFDKGRPFEPDFIMFLVKENKVKSIYQLFIEPKGNQFKDKNGRFEDSKEGWKEKFLLEIEERAEVSFKLTGKNLRLIGLPFYNEVLKKEFEIAFNDLYT